MAKQRPIYTKAQHQIVTPAFVEKNTTAQINKMDYQGRPRTFYYGQRLSYPVRA